MIDEPLVVPVSPGSALVRLTQVKAALQRHAALALALPGDIPARLQRERDNLLNALETDQPATIASALRAAQNCLCQLYETLGQLSPNLAPTLPASAEDEAGLTAHGASPNGMASVAQPTSLYSALGFPDPAQTAVQTVDIQSVLATFSKPVRQVLTTLAFQDAPRATAYWLVEVRFLRGERLEDYLIETSAPLFPRLRLPLGPHTFRIESRNSQHFTISDDFTVEVPAL